MKRGKAGKCFDCMCFQFNFNLGIGPTFHSKYSKSSVQEKLALFFEKIILL